MNTFDFIVFMYIDYSLEKLQERRKLLEEELQKKIESTLNSESRAEEMDKMLLEEETRITLLSKELEKIREKEVHYIISQTYIEVGSYNDTLL